MSARDDVPARTELLSATAQPFGPVTDAIVVLGYD